MAVEYLPGNVEQVEQLWISNRVVDVLTVFSGGENVAIPQHGQLLGKIALLHIQAGAEVIDAHLTLAEFIQDPDTQGVRESFEEFGFELAEFTHEYSYILIFLAKDNAELPLAAEYPGT